MQSRQPTNFGDESMLSATSSYREMVEQSPGGSEMSTKEKKKLYKSQKKARKTADNHDDDTGQTIRAGMLKFRSRLKNWHKFWAVVQPGKLLIYKENKIDWVGTVLLFGGEVHERPTSKNGFGFKFSNKDTHDLFTKRGPKGEKFSNFYILPLDSCIMRVPDTDQGAAWMEAIVEGQHAIAEHELRRPSIGGAADFSPGPAGGASRNGTFGMTPSGSRLDNLPKELSFRPGGADVASAADLNMDISPQELARSNAVPETQYTVSKRALGSKPGAEITRHTLEMIQSTSLWQELGNACQGDVIPHKDVPVVLLSNRSSLESMTDPYAFGHLLRDAADKEGPIKRMLGVTQWVLASMTCRSDGAKLPLGPVLGEAFRCSYEIGSVANRTFVLAEQVSPDTAAVYATNREAGWVVSGSTRPELKFWGNTMTVMNNATLMVTLTAPAESYRVTLPDTLLRGLTLSRISKDFVGQATITCLTSKVAVLLDFPHASHFEADGTAANVVTGTMNKDGVGCGTFRGNWDRNVMFVAAAAAAGEVSGETPVLTNDDQFRRECGKKMIVPKKAQQGFGGDANFADSGRIWDSVVRSLTPSSAPADGKAAVFGAYRTPSGPSSPNFFEQSGDSWISRDNDLRPWDPATGDFYVTSNEGKISVLDKNALKDTINVVASMPRSNSDATSAKLARRLSPSSVGGGGGGSTLSSRRTSGRAGAMSPPASSTFEDGEHEDVITQMMASNAMLLKRVEILEENKRQLYKLHLPILLILFYAMQVLVAALPYYMFLEAGDDDTDTVAP